MPSKPRRKFALVAPLLATLAVGRGAAQALAPPEDAEELVARERARGAVEAALELYESDAADGEQRIEHFVSAVDALVAFGPDAVPILVDELKQELQTTYFFAAYALGRLGTPSAAEALRWAGAHADEDPRREYGIERKAWAAFGLALMGQAEAVDLLAGGKLRASGVPVYGDTGVLEAAGMLTAPQSLTRLIAQLVPTNTDDLELEQQRLGAARALHRIADSAAVPRLLELLRDPAPPLRREAVHALAAIASPETIRGIVGVLGDEDSRVRKSAAAELARLFPPEALAPAEARLGSEQNSVVRGSLYLVVARCGGSSKLATLRSWWGRPDPVDRMLFVAALAELRSAVPLDLLEQALHDRDARVTRRAAEQLAARLGEPRARTLLLEAIPSPFWPLAQAAVEEIAQAGESSAGAPILHRLTTVELSEPVTDPLRRDRIQTLLEALVGLRHVAAIEPLRAAAARQTDFTLLRSIERTTHRLELLQQNGDVAAKWTTSLASPDAEERALAYRRLSELRKPDSAEALVQSFGRVEPDEGVEILRALARIDTPASRELVRRVLVAPEFDPIARLRLREMAAWAARQLGGEAMFEALRAAAERREGREAKVLIYLGVLGRDKALPLLARWDVPRMRYLRWSRGMEQERLHQLAQDIRGSRPLAAYDVPPERYPF
ncbi:MAG TPA: HEAT repeat domain-containing protein [Candidatus Polarisedimenticolaceae bacterium]|nr:HEAT repeat domain-containing protein [Candidatus Polarisedimenticolaceae bacterium]